MNSSQTRRTVAALGIAALLPVLSGCGEGGAYGITVIIEGTHRLDGESPGSLLVAGGDATVPEGAHVGGSVWVLGGSLTLAGTIAGDLAALGGEARLAPGAAVAGDLNLAGGIVSGLEHAQVAGRVEERAGLNIPFTPGWDSEQPFPTRLGTRMLGALLVGALAAIFALLVPRPLGRVGHAASAQPLVAIALGVLAIIVALPLIVFMAFTGVLIPIALLSLLLFGLGLAYGWSALGAVLLRRLAPPAASLPPFAVASLGAAALTLAAGLAQLIPILGEVVGAVLLSAAFGAVLLTRLGTRAARTPEAEAGATAGGPA